MALRSSLVAVAAAALLAAAHAATFHLSNVFGDHMVLQRNQPIRLWGWGTAGATVTTTAFGKPFSTTADASGFWLLTLPAQPASFNGTKFSIESSTGEVATLQDVLIGDVVFCGGQSNMEFTVRSAVNASAEIAAADLYPFIRVTSGPLQGRFNLSAVTPSPYNELAVIDLPWSAASAEVIGCPSCTGWDYYSAICWFTLRDTADANAAAGEPVPLGGIVESYGGTSIQYHSPPEAINACAPAAPGSACCNYGGFDSCMWFSQIAPWTVGPMPVAAFLWYQGEQNAGGGGAPQLSYYACALPALISTWRAAFGANDRTPFGVFTLAPWQTTPRNAPYFPLMRLLEVNASIEIPGVFTPSNLDAGDAAGGPIHSPYKQVPARRAAAALQSMLYGRITPYRGPRYASSTASVSGSVVTVTVSFDPTSVTGGLTLNTGVGCPNGIDAGSCEAFAIQTDDAACTWWGLGNTTAALSSDGTQLILTATLPSAAAGSRPVATRALFNNWPVVQLYNGAGLPVEPWYANVTGVANGCPSLWDTPAERAIAAAAGAHAAGGNEWHWGMPAPLPAQHKA